MFYCKYLSQSRKITVTLNIDGETGSRKIAPLLFIPLVEKALKHGVNRRPKSPFVGINFDLTESDSIRFSKENNYTIESNKDYIEKKGIGITNVKKRL